MGSIARVALAIEGTTSAVPAPEAPACENWQRLCLMRREVRSAVVEREGGFRESAAEHRVARRVTRRTRDADRA